MPGAGAVLDEDRADAAPAQFGGQRAGDKSPPAGDQDPAARAQEFLTKRRLFSGLAKSSWADS